MSSITKYTNSSIENSIIFCYTPFYCLLQELFLSGRADGDNKPLLLLVKIAQKGAFSEHWKSGLSCNFDGVSYCGDCISGGCHPSVAFAFRALVSGCLLYCLLAPGMEPRRVRHQHSSLKAVTQWQRIGTTLQSPWMDGCTLCALFYLFSNALSVYQKWNLKCQRRKESPQHTNALPFFVEMRTQLGWEHLTGVS